jgi:hypothetical protein
MPMPFKISADDIRCNALMARRDYYREHVAAALEGRLDCLKEPDFHSWPWMGEERRQVESEIADAQRTIAGIEAEIRRMGKDADSLEGYDLDLNSGS